MTIAIEHMLSDQQIAGTYEVMRQLRPQLDPDQYVSLIRGLMQSDGLTLIALSENGVVRAVATFRIMNMTYCGRLLYVDDLVTDERGVHGATAHN